METKIEKEEYFDFKNLSKSFLFSLRFHSMVAALIVIFPLIFMIKDPGMLINPEEDERLPLLLILFICGMLGGVINNYYRLSKLPVVDFTNPLTIKEKSINIIQIYVSLFISGALGLIFYSFIASGLVDGTFFPNFINLDSDYSGDVVNFFKEVTPDTNHDILKAMVWCFIAGFSEKLVPNTIDRLANKAEHKIDNKMDELESSNTHLNEVVNTQNLLKKELLDEINNLKIQIDSFNKK